MRFCDESEGSESVRDLLEPLPVITGSPNWLYRHVKNAIKSGDLPEPRHAQVKCSRDAMDYLANQISTDWWDHAGRLKWGEHQLLVTEPYGEKLTAESLNAVADLCETLGLAYQVSANSFHFPGRTIRIVIGPSDSVQAFRMYDYLVGHKRQRASYA